MRVIVVMNQKGGAGKTQTAVNLASALANIGKNRVLVVDIDGQDSVVDFAARAEREGVDIGFEVVSEKDPKVLSRLREADFDIIIVDTPGNLTEKALLKEAASQADFAVLPTEPAPMGLKPLINTWREIVVPSGVEHSVVVTRADPRSPGDVQDAKATLRQVGMNVAETWIRSYKDHERAIGSGRPVGMYEKTRRSGEAEKDYFDLALELTSTWAKSKKG